MQKVCQYGMLGFTGLLAFALTAPAGLVSSFQAGQGGWHMGTLAVGNLDGDPQLEIVVPYRDLNGQWHLDAFKSSGARLAGFPYSSGSEEMNTSPTLHDLDGDGRDEIIFTRGNSVIALRPNGSVLWSNRVDYANYVPQAGYQAVINGFYWSGDGAYRSRLPSTAVFSSQFSSPIVADIDGNGIKEVVTAWKIDPDSTSNHQDFNPFINDIFGSGEWGTVGETWSGAVIFFNAQTGARNLAYHLHQLVEAGIALGQADSDKPLEVYVLNDSDSVVCFDKTRSHGFLGNGMLHKMFGKNVAMMSGSYKQAVDIYAADVDGDGRDEVLAVTTQVDPLWQPHETLLDDNGAVLWRNWKQPVALTNNHGWLNNACMFAINPDRDNRIDVLGFTHSGEITFRSWDGINFVDRPGWPKNFAPFLPTPPVVGDVDGDGEQDIVIGTYEPSQTPSSGSLLVYSLDGTLKQSLPVPGGLKHIPSLADVNADGSLDVVYRSLNGVVYVQNFGAVNATNVSWATHRGNVRRDGNLGTRLFPQDTPVITKKHGGYGKAFFTWGGEATNNANAFHIYRAEHSAGPFTLVATLPAHRTVFADLGLRIGWQYFYEVAAVIGTNHVRSSPFAVLSSCNSNLVVNGGFEENDNSNWDKWHTTRIPWTNIIGSTSVVHSGKQSMKVALQNQGTTDSINQYGQYGIPDAYIPVTAGTLYSFGGFIKSTGLNQSTKHWFEWTSTITGENTNSRGPFPWPNYFTPHCSAAASATPWTYLNRVFAMPSGFPNVELRHRFSTGSPVSGTVFIDDVFFRPLPPATSALWNNLVSFGATWRYFTNTPPSNWFAEGFNDSAWPLGRAKFGCGGGPTNVFTVLPAGKPGYYFRGTFALTNANIEELLLAATCTDDYGGTAYPLRIWINGQELVTSGIETVSGSGNETKYFDLWPFIPLLRSGTNTIAVALSNSWQSTWDNVAFDVNLKALPFQAPEGHAPVYFQEIRRLPDRVELFVAAPAGVTFLIESAGHLAGPWQQVQSATGISGILQITDTGQNGRTPPSPDGHRFYRIVPLQ